MDRRLKTVNGKVTFYKKVGKDFVRNTMALSSAQAIISSGKQVKDMNVFKLNNKSCRCVDKTYYFELEEDSTQSEAKEEV